MSPCPSRGSSKAARSDEITLKEVLKEVSILKGNGFIFAIRELRSIRVIRVMR